MNTLTEQKIALLKGARHRIKNGFEDYICWALQMEDGSWYGAKEGKACKSLRKYIMKALRPIGEFEDWQRSKGLFKSYKQCQKDRVKWIDWMIKSLEGKL